MFQGPTNPFSYCSGQLSIFAGQLRYFLTWSEELPGEVVSRSSIRNFDL